MTTGEPPLYRVRVAELPADERPRERLLRLGPQALTASELLAILLRTGTAREDVLHVATRLLTLDTKHQLLTSTMLYRGALNSSPARIAELFREAVRQNAAAIAIAHNHPSGDPTPSRDDIAFTELAVEAGTLLQIEVLDHLVFGHARYVSMRERRLGFA